MCPHVYIALSRRIKGNTALIKLTRKTKEHERTCQMVQLIFCYNTHSIHSYNKILIIFFCVQQHILACMCIVSIKFGEKTTI